MRAFTGKTAAVFFRRRASTNGGPGREEGVGATAI